MAIAAGILDRYGGLRFVVCEAKELHLHRRPDEWAIIAHDVEVNEPIIDIAGLIACIEYHVDQWINARSIPNDPAEREAIVMYRLRQLENQRHSLDLDNIVQT
jgi:hypothetical protein